MSALRDPPAFPFVAYATRCPTGKSLRARWGPCPPLRKKINYFAAGRNQLYSPPIPPPLEGRIAIVTDVGCGDAVDALASGARMTQADEGARADEPRRVVLIPRRWDQVLPMTNRRGEGGKKARSPRRQ